MGEQLQRRADDGEKAATLLDVIAILNEMKANQQGYMSAFVLDDLGRPDYTGHRLDHKQRIEDAKRLQQDKNKMTLTMLEWVTKGAVGLVLLALVNGGMTYIAQHLK
jgi:hypothetical protein